MSDAAADLSLAFELVDLTRSIAVPRFQARDFATETKGDGSPVTEVDVAVETAQRGVLAGRRPDQRIVGEERGETGDSPWCWYLDPIDGTALFVDGNPGWMSLVALADGDLVVLGVVDRPMRDERWWAARGNGAFRDGSPVRVSATTRLRDAVVQDTWRGDLARGERDHPLAWIAARAGEVRPHSGHSMLAVACGEIDAAVAVGGGPWDYAPMKAIVEEAGGRATDLEGGARLDRGALVATNGLLHDEVLAVIAARGGGLRH